MLKRHGLVVAAVAIMGVSSVAFGADLPLKAPPVTVAAPSWTGFYGGVNAGYGWSSANYVATPVGVSPIADMPVQASINRASGALFGGQVGYNWQVQNWLLAPPATPILRPAIPMSTPSGWA
jgi:outer membrane immunogenic protein